LWLWNRSAINDSELEVDCIDKCTGHVERVRELLQQNSTVIDSHRFNTFTGDFMDVGWKPQKKYDIVVVSAVLHFYKSKEIIDFVRKIHSFLNDSGIVIMSNISNKITPLTQLISNLVDEWSHWYDGINYLSSEKMHEICSEVDYKILSNQYVGSTNDADMNNYEVYPWYTGGLNIKKCILHTVLTK